MSKSGNEPTQAIRKARKSKQGRDVPRIEDDLNRTFEKIRSEEMPERLKDLAERLDRAIATVLRKKTH
ncbi:MAG TPA: hypothetical protein VMP03_03610 [Methylomirabilota bacterium]|nr:hypothetical protein [Methylomirabilota bacterium]